jgi:hypothetical protein
MGTTAHFAINDGERDVAASAARWLAGFTPQVQATLDDTGVRLRSEQHDSAALTAVWAAALANEVSHQRAQAQRAAAYGLLAQ